MAENEAISRNRRLSDAEARGVAAFWRHFLRIEQELAFERIHPRQVTDERGRPGCSLVGVIYDADTAYIYHTRALTEEDIVHELLHVAHPAWQEAAVVAETCRLLSRMRRAGGRSEGVWRGTALRMYTE